MVLLGDDVLIVSEDIYTCSGDDWTLDSGCINHVYSMKDYFNMSHEVNSGNMSLGNGSPCKMKSIGTVKIKKYDGVIRTLGRVRFVPKM